MTIEVDEVRLYQTLRTAEIAIITGGQGRRWTTQRCDALTVRLPAAVELFAEILYESYVSSIRPIQLTALILGPNGNAYARQSIDFYNDGRDIVRIEIGSVTFTNRGTYSFTLLVDSVPAFDPLQFDVTDIDWHVVSRGVTH
jgi:hypothetical protein